MGSIAKYGGACLAFFGVIFFVVTFNFAWISVSAAAVVLIFVGEIIDLLKKIVEQTARRNEKGDER